MPKSSLLFEFLEIFGAVVGKIRGPKNANFHSFKDSSVFIRNKFAVQAFCNTSVQINFFLLKTN